ncbi:hypothetical protein EX30DRAFT_6161 [Ascodesmis nigricans]|uniref:Uncharacterized protein n=1 Tax=Ascodesmis nigricans TaxID=341454 RepID=A0A4S2N695_9PEZI|nr:hypothetical protein EX30DRAFT_6161 [Ascodesmis nigricans]
MRLLHILLLSATLTTTTITSATTIAPRTSINLSQPPTSACPHKNGTNATEQESYKEQFECEIDYRSALDRAGKPGGAGDGDGDGNGCYGGHDGGDVGGYVMDGEVERLRGRRRGSGWREVLNRCWHVELWGVLSLLVVFFFFFCYWP